MTDRILDSESNGSSSPAEEDYMNMTESELDALEQALNEEENPGSTQSNIQNTLIEEEEELSS